MLSSESMPTLELSALSYLLAPYLQESRFPEALLPGLSVYLDLLLKWNARTNLTAIRQPEEIVRRHFGESLFAGLHLPSDARTLLDYGSGAGFPGLPIQLLRPEMIVTLAESQGKKASFLREVVRSLGLQTEVFAHRVESMPDGRRFDIVTLRAVDKMDLAEVAALRRVAPGGTLAVLTSGREGGVPVPGSGKSVLSLYTS